MENHSPSKKVLVVGSTGYLGMEICRQLKVAGKSVRGLVRTTSDPAKVSALKQMEVETVVGDIKEPESIKAALEGVSIVISTASSTLSRQQGDSIETVDCEGQLNVVKAAKQAGVEQFVFISFNELEDNCPLQDAKRKVEASIRESGLTYTILQPTLFMEVWLSPAIGFDYANASVNIYGEGKNKISWIAIKDVAAFAVASLDNPDFKNKSVELGGPEGLSPLEVVQIFEEKSRKPFSIHHVPQAALHAQKQAATDSLSESFSALMLSYSHGSEIDMTTTSGALPHALTTVDTYAQLVSQY